MCILIKDRGAFFNPIMNMIYGLYKVAASQMMSKLFTPAFVIKQEYKNDWLQNRPFSPSVTSASLARCSSVT